MTLGADIAITSVLMSQLKRLYPSADIIVIGTSKLAQLYGGESRIRIKPIDYGRNANLLTRLLSWREVVAAVQDETVGLNTQEYCLFDPDSRLTQLGLMPLLSPTHERQNYFYFESRSFTRPGHEKLGQLTSQWLNDLIRTSDVAFPFISLSPNLNAIGVELTAHLRSHCKQPILCLSFGVGGNEAKRVSDKFEQELAIKLSQYHSLVLDCGATLRENELAERILSALQTSGKSVLRLNESTYSSNILPKAHPTQLIAWNGGIGSFAALIANCDRYIGYDSSGQHIAAASAIPTHTVFVNSNSATFARRWQPYGVAKTHVSFIDASQKVSEEFITNRILNDLSLSDSSG